LFFRIDCRSMAVDSSILEYANFIPESINKLLPKSYTLEVFFSIERGLLDSLLLEFVWFYFLRRISKWEWDGSRIFRKNLRKALKLCKISRVFGRAKIQLLRRRSLLRILRNRKLALPFSSFQFVFFYFSFWIHEWKSGDLENIHGIKFFSWFFEKYTIS